ncbi:acetyl-CoA hydrolase/transferase C-terminal domain-containing protein [Lentisalinibacter sediminis]|uniref:acetyl-CoA hydrolase/transferase C-terminal domain-containing protein n=1 Tax=Lentisalinibacter sediminis TaxID=2992237 RepID=UPI0038635C54
MSAAWQDPGALADAIIARVGRHLVLGLPVGLGKAVHVANALYERAATDSSLRLTIFTALTLQVPRAQGDLEQRFLAPLVERLYADWPALHYAQAIRAGTLPPNIEVREFYFRPGAYLGTPSAQQSYTSINYSQVVTELMRLGVNVVGQLVSARPESPGRYSLSCNPEITLDLVPAFREAKAAGREVAMVAQVNRRLPYMTGDAEVPTDTFDFVLDAPEWEYPLFGLPNRAVEAADYATGMHVASLVADGGTLQLGIGSLSDAVAHCLALRNEQPDLFRDVLERLPGGSASPRRAALPLETAPFREGLYGSSELMSDALFSLFERDILRRSADAGDDTVLHGGFFIGSSAFYEALRRLPEDRRRLVNMTSISRVNTLYGDEERKRRQRRDARFINETMMATLLGAAVSDGLEGGRVVSGVGGQFDFVSMAQALPDGLSVLMLRSRRLHDGRPQSNIRWSYPHATVPRHYRDVFVSEYGIAATRGRPDREVIAGMLDIADSAFQDELLESARAAGKVPDDHAVSADARRNTPEVLESIFGAPDVAPHFPPYPHGTDLTTVEQELAGALTWLKGATARLPDRLRVGLAAMRDGRADGHRRYAEHLERLELGSPAGLRQRIMRRLVILALARSKRERP